MKKVLKVVAKVFGVVVVLVAFVQISFVGILLFAANNQDYDAKQCLDRLLEDNLSPTPAKNIFATIKDIRNGSDITIPLSIEEYYVGSVEAYFVGRMPDSFIKAIPDSLLLPGVKGESFFLVECGPCGRAFVYLSQKLINEAFEKQLKSKFFTL